jgi:hypothetical protein
MKIGITPPSIPTSTHIWIDGGEWTLHVNVINIDVPFHFSFLFFSLANPNTLKLLPPDPPSDHLHRRLPCVLSPSKVFLAAQPSTCVRWEHLRRGKLRHRHRAAICGVSCYRGSSISPGNNDSIHTAGAVAEPKVCH